VVADSRSCEQCGTSFVPRREHARFCSPSCRAAWNRGHAGDLKTGTSALQWSITAMDDTAKRLARMTAWDQPRAFVLTSEAVWWVTIVDATLVRHHLDAYDRVMADQTPAERELTEQTLAGLRFVRNRIGDEADLAEFIQPSQNGSAPAAGRVADWRWRSVPEPKLAKLPPPGQAWEMSRYQAYQAQLAGHTIGETFGRATAFLKRAVAAAPTLADVSAQPHLDRAPSFGPAIHTPPP
jgi:hypothetical protein